MVSGAASVRLGESERPASSEPVERDSQESGDFAGKPAMARYESDRIIFRPFHVSQRHEKDVHRGQVRQHFTGEHQAIVDHGHDYRNGIGAPLLC